MQELGDELQMLVDNTLQRQKYVYNIVLGVSSDAIGFSWAGAAGMADPSTKRPMKGNTPLLIASVTKMYTAAAIMILVERGELRLSDKISQYLPNDLIRGLHHYRGADYTERLTIYHLISRCMMCSENTSLSRSI